LKESNHKQNAKVVLCKCPETKKTFGIRIEERGTDWVRTWAFKIDEDKAKREGFDTTKSSGTMHSLEEYPGCPYCGTYSLAQCSCGRIFCWSKKTTGQTICPWCGQTGEYRTAEKLDVQGGGF
jgi:hypothetical protein